MASPFTGSVIGSAVLMATIEERLAKLEARVQFLIIVILGTSGIQLVPIVSAMFK